MDKLEEVIIPYLDYLKKYGLMISKEIIRDYLEIDEKKNKIKIRVKKNELYINKIKEKWENWKNSGIVEQDSKWYVKKNINIPKSINNKSKKIYIYGPTDGKEEDYLITWIDLIIKNNCNNRVVKEKKYDIIRNCWKYHIKFNDVRDRSNFMRTWFSYKKNKDIDEKYMAYTVLVDEHKIKNIKNEEIAINKIIKNYRKAINNLNNINKDKWGKKLNDIFLMNKELEKEEMKINDNEFDFLKIYKTKEINKVKDFTNIIKKEKTKKEKINIINWNIGGKLNEKIKPNGELKEIIDKKQPMIITLQEHQLICNEKRAYKDYEIEGYEMIVWQPALVLNKEKNNNNKINNNFKNKVKDNKKNIKKQKKKVNVKKGRRSGGLVIYVKKEIYNDYNIIINKNDNQIQKITLYNEDNEIHLTNIYIRPQEDNGKILGKLKEVKKIYNQRDVIDKNVKDLNKNNNNNKRNKINKKKKIMGKIIIIITII